MAVKKKQKKGDGSVHLRKDGRWEGRYVIGYGENGYPKTKNVLARTKSECLEKLKKLKAECGVPHTERIKPDMRFGAWIDYWYQTYCRDRLRPTTRQGYEAAIYRHIIPQLGTIPLNKMTQNDLQQFYHRLKQTGRLHQQAIYGKQLSDRTVRCCHANCRSALERAVKDGLLRSNPAVGCKLPPKKAREMQVLTQEELQRFLLQAREEGYLELFLLDLATGLRRGELLSLQWSDLDFETGELTVNKQICRVEGALRLSEPKTQASVRTVLLPPSLLSMLESYQKRVNSRWMFPSPIKEDTPLDPAAVRKRLQRILEHAQCKRVRFHDLRHTFATMALERGMDVKTLSALLGHVSAGTTLDIYTHITDTMQRDAARRIDCGINGGQLQTSSPGDYEVHAEKQAEPFQPYRGRRRRPGTGCVSQINDQLWEGRYSPKWPDGKKRPRNIYAHSREECEEKLAEMIAQTKAEIAAAREIGHQ